MNVTISIGGPFPSPYRLAEYLNQNGKLERIISPMPRFRLEPVRIPHSRLLTIPWLGYFNYGLSKLPYFSGVTPRQWWFSEMFDKAASERLGECDLFNGWLSVSLHSMRRAKARGAIAMLMTGSAHIGYQKQLIESECRQFGVKRIVTDPRIVEKGIAEYHEANHIIVASSFIRRTLLENGVPDFKITVVPDAVTRSFPTAKGYKEDDVFRVIAVGRLEFRKGTHYLMEAFSQLRLPKSELLLVGEPQHEFAAMLEKYAGSFKAVGRASGSELGHYFSQSSVFVLPSVEDGWGHVTLEAMSCGLPAIVSANAGSADAVRDGINGFVIPARDTQAIMEKLELLYKNSDAREAMGAAARKSTKHRTWESHGRQIVQVFESLIAKKR